MCGSRMVWCVSGCGNRGRSVAGRGVWRAVATWAEDEDGSDMETGLLHLHFAFARRAIRHPSECVC
jgi:hypothetical protein